MSAELTEEQGAIREMALEFAQTKLTPYAREWARRNRFPPNRSRRPRLRASGSRVRKLSTDRRSADQSASCRRGDQPQLKARAVTVKTGTLVNATLITSASHDDAESAWSKHRRRKAVLRFKANVSADAETALRRRRSDILQTQHCRAGLEGLPKTPGDV